MKFWWIVAGVCVVLLAVLLFKSSFAKPVTDVDAFAKCLTEEGAELYGAEWCGHCQEQKRLFGDSFKHVNYIECASADGQAEVCVTEGIAGYPTWKFADGSSQPGMLSFEKLAERTGCDL